MKKKVFLMLSFLFVWIGLALAQGVTVKGIVTSADDGLPVVGASVLVKGTTTGTITDVDGRFTIPNVSSSAKTIVFCGNADSGNSH